METDILSESERIGVVPRFLGGQNSSARLKKNSLAGRVTGLPGQRRAKAAGVEVFTVSSRQCSRTHRSRCEPRLLSFATLSSSTDTREKRNASPRCPPSSGCRLRQISSSRGSAEGSFLSPTLGLSESEGWEPSRLFEALRGSSRLFEAPQRFSFKVLDLEALDLQTIRYREW